MHFLHLCSIQYVCWLCYQHKLFKTHCSVQNACIHVTFQQAIKNLKNNNVFTETEGSCSNHIVVIHRGRFFICTPFQEDGEPWTEGELEKYLINIETKESSQKMQLLSFYKLLYIIYINKTGTNKIIDGYCCCCCHCC